MRSSFLFYIVVFLFANVFSCFLSKTQKQKESFSQKYVPFLAVPCISISLVNILKNNSSKKSDTLKETNLKEIVGAIKEKANKNNNNEISDQEIANFYYFYQCKKKIETYVEDILNEIKSFNELYKENILIAEKEIYTKEIKEGDESQEYLICLDHAGRDMSKVIDDHIIEVDSKKKNIQIDIFSFQDISGHLDWNIGEVDSPNKIKESRYKNNTIRLIFEKRSYEIEDPKLWNLDVQNQNIENYLSNPIDFCNKFLDDIKKPILDMLQDLAKSFTYYTHSLEIPMKTLKEDNEWQNLSSSCKLLLDKIPDLEKKVSIFNLKNEEEDLNQMKKVFKYNNDDLKDIKVLIEEEDNNGENQIEQKKKDSALLYINSMLEKQSQLIDYFDSIKFEHGADDYIYIARIVQDENVDEKFKKIDLKTIVEEPESMKEFVKEE